jgi:aminopeptidase N
MTMEAHTNTQTPQAIRLADYRPPDWRIGTIDLDFELGEAATRVRARMAIRTLETLVEIHPETNTALDGLYKSGGNFCSQCEAEGFRRITWFLDRPDALATYRTTITAEKARYPVLLSNGNLVETADLPGGLHRAVWHDPWPKPAYLFALVAGDLGVREDTYSTGSGREVTCRIYVERGNEDRCGWAMEALKNAMRWDEEVFGLEYDLDIYMIVAVSDFNMGAMENKGLNVFNDKFVLARPDTATDGDYEFIESVIAHEYFHNWTGNRVTCRDWFQLSLKEGLTVFRDQQFSADMRGAAVKRIGDVRMLRARQFPEDAGPLAHPIRPDSYIEINNFYTATIYEKGAEVVRMIHTLLGPEGFRKGLDLYFERHDGQAVTCEDFVAAMEAATGEDLNRFRLWYVQAGTPKLKATGRYDAAGEIYELTLSQTCPPTPGQEAKEPLHIPVAVGLLDEAGGDIPLRLVGENRADAPSTRMLELTEAVQTFRFADIAEHPTPSILRGFSAPVIVEQALLEKDRLHLMAHDTDPFNRWQAAQDIALELLLRIVKAVQRGNEPPADPAFVAALGRTLADETLDPAFAAEMLALPGEDVIAERMEVVDVEAVHGARKALALAVAEGLREPLMEAYRRNLENSADPTDTAAGGRRALKNRALAYLMETGEPEIGDLCLRQYEEAATMTDSIAALTQLAHRDSPHRRRTLADFRQKWAGDKLVLDKWFAVQATSPRADTLARVRELMRDSAFTQQNPNKVRALIGAFATANPLRFHAADGSGYEFLADRVLELDAGNPQVAARLLTPMGRWHRHDEGRRALMRAQLRRILDHEGLSKDSFEIAGKSLG